MIWILIVGCLAAGFAIRSIVDELYPRRKDELFREYLRREYGGKAESDPNSRGGRD